MAVATCTLCGSMTAAPLFEKGGQRFFQCRRCRFRFGRSEANANFAQHFDDYEPAYRQYLGASPVDRANHEATVAWVERFVSVDDPAMALLDVGAGSGKFLAHLRARRRCRSTGVEPSSVLHRTFDLDCLGVANLTLPAFSESSMQTFDVVTALDVIEHVAEPVEFAQALFRVTRPGGYVFLSTPDAGSLVARALGRHWHHYNRYHFSLFDSRAIVRLGRAAGFEAVELVHRGKRFPARYLQNYARDFLLPSRRRSRTTGEGGDWVLSLNLFDIMSVVWRRPAGPATGVDASRSGAGTHSGAAR